MKGVDRKRGLTTRRRQEAVAVAVFSDFLLQRLTIAKLGLSNAHLFGGAEPNAQTVLERLKHEAHSIGDRYRADLEKEERKQPPTEYIKRLKAARVALMALHDLPDNNYVLNEDGMLAELAKTGAHILPAAEAGDAIRRIIHRELGQALWWLETLNIHADAAILSGKRGPESPALNAAEFAVCWHAGFWKARCGLTQEEFHDLALGYWIAAGLPEKGNAKDGNTLRAYVRKSMKSQLGLLEKLVPI